MRLGKRAIATIVLACCVSIAAPVTVAATPRAAASTAQETQTAQLAVLDEIARWDALQPTSSIGATAIDPATGAVEVGWAGPVPEAVRALAEQAPEDIDVTFTTQRQSEEATVGQLLDAAAALPGDASIAFDIDGDDVTVAVPSEDAADDAGTDTLPVDADGVQAIEETIAGAGGSAIDVSVVTVDEVPSTAARRGDIQDLRGGSTYATRLPDGSNQWCTSGFQAVSGQFQHFITAAHCSNWNDGLAVLSSGGTRLGTTTGAEQLVRGASSYDLQLVRLDLDIRNRSSIYTSDTSTRAVTGWLRTIPAGAMLCQSGSISGNVCTLRVEGPGVACYQMSSGGAQCVDIVRVTATTGNAICRGDSGGPVYSAGANATAVAAGVVSGVRLQPGDTRCSPLGYIAPIADLMSVLYGVQLRAVTS